MNAVVASSTVGARCSFLFMKQKKKNNKKKGIVSTRGVSPKEIAPVAHHDPTCQERPARGREQELVRRGISFFFFFFFFFHSVYSAVIPASKRRLKQKKKKKRCAKTREVEKEKKSCICIYRQNDVKWWFERLHHTLLSDPRVNRATQWSRRLKK